MAPQGPETTDGSRRAQPSLDAPGPEFTAMLEQYCDLRRRGFSQTEIQTKLQLKRHQPSLLLAEAAKRGMPGSEDNQSEAVAEWLLSCFDAGIEVSAIRRMSALTERGIKQRLKRALDTASGNPPSSLITPAPDGTPGRVSWLDPGGRLMHRPFDGAVPAHYTAETALAQCRQVFIELLDHPEGHARDRAYTMLRLAQSGLHAFDREAGQELYDAMDNAGLDDDAKRTVVLKLHDHPYVQQLLLERCGISPRWLDGKRARFLSRRTREYGHTPAFTHHAVELLGHDPDAYYMIGVEHRIPEPTPEAKAKCVDVLMDAGFSPEAVETAMSVLGVPRGGRHPPKRKQ